MQHTDYWSKLPFPQKQQRILDELVQLKKDLSNLIETQHDPTDLQLQFLAQRFIKTINQAYIPATQVKGGWTGVDNGYIPEVNEGMNNFTNEYPDQVLRFLNEGSYTRAERKYLFKAIEAYWSNPLTVIFVHTTDGIIPDLESRIYIALSGLETLRETQRIIVSQGRLKAQIALEALQNQQPLDEIAKKYHEHNVTPEQIQLWKTFLINWIPVMFINDGLRPAEEKIENLEDRIDQLKQEILDLKQITLSSPGA